jgi:hypothetical protein
MYASQSVENLCKKRHISVSYLWQHSFPALDALVLGKYMYSGLNGHTIHNSKISITCTKDNLQPVTNSGFIKSLMNTGLSFKQYNKHTYSAQHINSNSMAESTAVINGRG